MDVQPRGTWVQYIKTVHWTIVGSSLFCAGIYGMLTGETGFWKSSVFLAFGFLGVYMAMTRVTNNYKISTETLEIKTLNKRQSIAWADVTSVDIVPTFFGEPSIGVKTLNSKPEVISTAYFANTKTLNQAIAEAACMQNSDVKIGNLVVAHY